MPILSVVLGLAVGIVFVRRQQTLADPFIDLNLFRVPAFSASLTTYTLAIFAAFGVFLFIAQYLQLVVGLSPLQAGLFSLPGAITSVIGSNTAPILVRRVRPAFVVATGLALGAIGFGLMSQLGSNSLFIIVFAWALMSFGFGLTFTLTADLVVGSAPAERAGAASAISETGAELGGALGIALLGSLGIAIYRGLVTSSLPPGIPPESVQVAMETLGGAVAVAEQLPPQLGAALLDISRSAFVQGLRVISLIGVGIMLFLTIMTGIALRNVKPGGEVEEETLPAHQTVSESKKRADQSPISNL
jgi:DHA2 family multidrug resistance protein-like MFS transporter